MLTSCDLVVWSIKAKIPLLKLLFWLVGCGCEQHCGWRMLTPYCRMCCADVMWFGCEQHCGWRMLTPYWYCGMGYADVMWFGCEQYRGWRMLTPYCSMCLANTAWFGCEQHFAWNMWTPLSRGRTYVKKTAFFYAKKEEATQIWKCRAFTVRKKQWPLTSKCV